jgi:hypothetical protein
MFHTIIGKWHIWESNGRILISDEDKKMLTDHPTMDDAFCHLHITAKEPATAREFRDRWRAAKS